MDQIPSIPPGVSAADLIGTLNDRIRRINVALTGTASTSPATDNEVQTAAASASLTLTTAHQYIAGASLTLKHAGRYLVLATVYFTASDASPVNLIAGLETDGTEQSAPLAIYTGPTGSSATVGQVWAYTAPAVAKAVRLKAWRASAAGTSQAVLSFTTITAVWIGP